MFYVRKTALQSLSPFGWTLKLESLARRNNAEFITKTSVAWLIYCICSFIRDERKMNYRQNSFHRRSPRFALVRFVRGGRSYVNRAHRRYRVSKDLHKKSPNTKKRHAARATKKGNKKTIKTTRKSVSLEGGRDRPRIRQMDRAACVKRGVMRGFPRDTHR